jgi:hypothetical protein
MRSNF